jgi:hypothetical protein
MTAVTAPLIPVPEKCQPPSPSSASLASSMLCSWHFCEVRTGLLSMGWTELIGVRR